MTSTQFTQIEGPVGDMYRGGGISHAALIPPTATRVVTSGEGGLDLVTGKLVTTSLEAQIVAAFDVVEAVLRSAGVEQGVKGAYKIVALVLDMKNEALLMKIFNERYPDHHPTFMTYGVAQLALEGMEVELQAEAILG